MFYLLLHYLLHYFLFCLVLPFLCSFIISCPAVDSFSLFSLYNFSYPWFSLTFSSSHNFSVINSLLLHSPSFLFHPHLSFALCSSHNYPFFIIYLLIFLWCKILCSLSNFLLLFNRHKTRSLINSYSLFVTPWPLFVIKSSVGTLQQICWVFHTYQFPLIMASVDRNRQFFVTKEQETIKVSGSSVNHIACQSSSRNVIISHANKSLSLLYIYIVYSSY